jgi:L-lysine exporter family protein LysE/ArgO
LLVGSVASRFGDYSVAFWAGASLGSAVFFVALGYGARFLAPLMARAGSWRVLEFGIGVVMTVIAAGLVWSAI